VKSYDESSPSIILQSGVNAIIGENGSGKSTLCEAVGFALFDFLHPYSQADFIREGNKSGKVSVTFKSDHTNHVYRVERGVGVSRYDIIDVERDTKVSLNGKDDVLTWLKEELGVPRSMDLQTLWKSSIGVPQGKFTNDFAETPSIRAQLFNPLLEVDVYRDLWKKMKSVVDVIVEQKNELIDHITRLESLVKELPELEQQAKKRKKQIQKAKKEVSKIKQLITTIAQEKKRLDILQKDIDQLTQQVNLKKEKNKDIEKQIERAKKQYQEAKKAKHIVSHHAKRFEKYITNANQLEYLLKEKKKKESLEQKKTALEKKYSVYQEQFRQVQEKIEIAKRSKQEINALKTSVKQQEHLEETLTDLSQKEKEIHRIQKDIAQIKEKISNFRKEFRTVQKQIKKISNKKEIADEHHNLQQKKDDLLKKQSVVSHQRTEEEKAISLLKNKTESVCPTCNRPLDEAHRKEIITEKQKRVDRAKQNQEDVHQQLEQITTKLQESREAEQQVKRLSDLKSRLSHIQKIADEYKEKKESLDKDLSFLHKEFSEKASIKQQLNKLGNPKQAFQKAQVRYEDHKGKTTEKKELKDKITEIEEQQHQMINKLKKYEGIEQKIDSLKQTQKELKESYESYLQNKDQASKLTYWKDHVDNLTDQHQDLKHKIQTRSQEIALKKKEFDKEEFEHLKKEYEEKKQQQIRQETQIDEWIKQKQEIDIRLREKKEQKEQLQNLEIKRLSINKDIEFAQFLRESYQKSRPLITEILVEEISREADRIYRELRGVPSEELSWKKDYEIVVYESGNKRAFHKLSGGEQMCAALSIRLAILKLLSTLDIVFLDEPTVNLDEEKKNNLVTQLRELTGFSQIFVISHDETFESMTEHIITLEKRQGSTRLLNHFQGGF